MSCFDVALVLHISIYIQNDHLPFVRALLRAWTQAPLGYSNVGI
jgi:hypothetical protein